MLFADAEKDQKERGDESDLHVIIFDEIDAIARTRGRDDRDLTDNVVNQPLTKIDGMKALNNVLIIGITNRKDLLEEAILRFNGMVECGERHKHVYVGTMYLVNQVKMGMSEPLLTCLLEGPRGSGKTAMAATIGIDSDIPYVKIVSAEWMIGLSEISKCEKIVKVFEDAYKSSLSIVILDDIERLLEYIPIGPCFSRLIVQTLLVLLQKLLQRERICLLLELQVRWHFLISLLNFAMPFMLLIMCRNWPRKMS